MDQRLREAAKLGFTEAWMPKSTGRKPDEKSSKGVSLIPLGHIQDLVDKFA
jgi:predicted ATP-dependent serine protease